MHTTTTNRKTLHFFKPPSMSIGGINFEFKGNNGNSRLSRNLGPEGSDLAVKERK